MPSKQQFEAIRSGYHADPSRSLSLRAEAYTDPAWFAVDQQEIVSLSWQWICHAEKVRTAGTYTTAEIAGNPIAIVRDEQGVWRAFYNEPSPTRWAESRPQPIPRQQLNFELILRNSTAPPHP